MKAPPHMRRNGLADCDRIVAAVAGFYGMKREVLTGSSRKSRIAWARHVATYFILTLEATSQAVAAKAVLRKDHHSAWLSKKRVLDAMDVYPEIKKEIDELARQLAIGNPKSAIP